MRQLSGELRHSGGDYYTPRVSLWSVTKRSVSATAAEDEAHMERTVETAIRALDNVIDPNSTRWNTRGLTNCGDFAASVWRHATTSMLAKARHPLGEAEE